MVINMTYLEKAAELQENIKHNLNHSDEIDLNVVKEWNELIGDIYGQIKTWDDEYEEK